MIVPPLPRWFRSTAFLAANLAIALGLWFLTAAPAITMISTRAARIRSQEAALSRFQAMIAAGPKVARFAARLKLDASNDAFLQGSNQGVIDAALQERLKTVAERSKTQVKSVQTLSTRTIGGLDYSGARIEVSGSIKGIQSTVYAIENSKPWLFITSAIMRVVDSGRNAPSEEPKLQAQFDVYGVMIRAGANE